MRAPELDQYLDCFRGKLGPAIGSQGVGSLDHLPSVFECGVHLELLDAIVRMKGEVDACGKEDGLGEGVAWNVYCSAAVLRFLKWSQAAEAEESTPQLDVLMVWHTYMLNTAAYRQYENCVLKGRLGHKGINWVTVVSRSLRPHSYLVLSRSSNLGSREQHQRIKDGGFNISTEDAAAMNQLPLPADLLGALKKGEIRNGITILPPPANFDLVAAVQRQLKFAHKMHSLEWLRSPFAHKILKTAISRYEMFFTLIAEHPGNPLSPTQDIDLVWHTHQLSPKRYGLYSAMKAGGTFINHNDAADKHSLDKSFSTAEALFRERFGREYLVCYCGRCISSRAAGYGDGKGLVVHVGSDPSSSCNANCNDCSNGCKTSSCSGASCGAASCSGGSDNTAGAITHEV
jgi:hypothetical protein